MKAKVVKYLPGVGVDTKKIADTFVDVVEKKKEIGIPENAFTLISVGELNSNKNHEVVVRAMEQLPENIHYVIAGKGDLDQHLMDTARGCGVEDRLHLVGYRSDVAELLKSADVFIFPSFREGLPLSVIEAMAASKPVVGSRIRGNTDLVEDGKGGFLVPAGEVAEYAKSIAILYHNAEKREQMGQHNSEKAKQYDVENINRQMARIYESILL